MMRRNRLASLAAAAHAALFGGMCALGQTVFTTDTVISTGQYDSQDITVRGCTVAVNGSHTFRSITVERNAANQPGILNHSPLSNMNLSITTDFTIQGASGSLVASRLDASGRGSLSGTGPSPGVTGQNMPGGGASHGGRGGAGFVVTSAPTGTYGLIVSPNALGSGGANGCGSTLLLGGAGGGFVTLRITGTLTVDGVIAANGDSGLSGASTTCATTAGGGGSGGSIFLTVGALAGSGTISANGGDGGRLGEVNAGGGGGGGRIAILNTTTPSAFTGVVTAYGGNGNTPGGAGTVLRQYRSDPWTTRIENSRPGGVTEWLAPTGTGTMIIGPNASIVGPRFIPASVTVTFQGDLTIEQGGSFNLDGQGYPANAGSGFGSTNNVGGGSGAGYGGAGGRASGTAPWGACYGSLSDSGSVGSGGGRWCAQPSPSAAGSGGGYLRLTVSGTLRNDGVISANGFDGGVSTSSSCLGAGGGGGSGGGVYLTAGTFLGSGIVSANGGAGGNPAGGTLAGGGGGGGRIIIIHTTANTFTGPVSAIGGLGYERGGAGSIFTRASQTGAPITVLYSNGAGPTGAMTELNTPLSITGNLIVGPGTRLGPRQSFAVSMQVSGDVTVQSGGAITFDAKGSSAGGGSGFGGAAPSTSGFGGGGGHGGAGGTVPGQGAGGQPFGSAFSPTSPGGGGGNACASTAMGGAGGGILRVTAGGTLRVDGRLSADGAPGTPGSGNCPSSGAGGGGAGGSVWIIAHTVSGQGVISASGGAAGLPGGAGGGGGRIAIYSCDRQMSSSQVLAAGGAGAAPGGTGIIFLGSNSVVFSPNLSGRTTSAGTPFSLTVHATGDGPLSYQWYYSVIPLADGDRAGRISGVHTSMLTIDAPVASDSGTYYVLVTDNCGGLSSNGASISVVCRADVDDGSGTGQHDQGVTIDDLTFFLSKYGAGDLLADLDDGSGTGNSPDGGVTIEDLLYFLSRYNAGC